MQEVVVALKTTVRCGSLTTRWEHVEYVARSLLATGWIRALKKVYGSNVIPNFVQTISNIRANFSELREGQAILLSLLLSACRRFKCTDPRDKVTALVGLADYRSLWSSASELLDYSKPVEDLYFEVTGQVMKRERSLNLLSSVEDMSDRTLNLPSWVPDYRVWQRHTILGSSIRVAHLNFHAANQTPVSFKWMSGSRSLAINGFTHDRIDAVSARGLDRPGEDTHVVPQWLQLVEPLIRRGCLGIESLWQTLIGNAARHIFFAPEQYATHVKSGLSPIEVRRQGYIPGAKTWNSETNALVNQAALGYMAAHRKLFVSKGGHDWTWPSINACR